MSVTFYGLGSLTLAGWVVMILALPFALFRKWKTPQPLVINHSGLENARSEFGLDTLSWSEVRDIIRYEDEDTDMVGINLVPEAAHRKPRKWISMFRKRDAGRLDLDLSAYNFPITASDESLFDVLREHFDRHRES